MRKLTLDDFKNYKFLSGIEHSPDGRHVGFVVHEADMEENKYRSNLYLAEVATRKVRKLTTFDKESSFKWQDDEHLVFATIRDPKDKEAAESHKEFTQLYRIPIHGGEADKYLRLKKSLGSFDFLAGGDVLATCAFDLNAKDQLNLSETELSDELKRLKEEEDYEVLEEIPFWSNGGGFTSKKRSRLCRFDAQGTFQGYLTGEYTNVESVKLNEEKDKAVLVSSTFQDKEELLNELSYFDGETVRVLDTPGLTISFADFLDKDTLIFTATDMKKLGLNENGKFYTYDLLTDTLTLITPDLDQSLYNSVGSDARYGGSKTRVVDGGELYFTTTLGTNAELWKVNREGVLSPVITEEGSVDGVSVKNGHVAYIAMKNTTLQELYFLDEPTLSVSSFNTWVQEEIQLSIPEPLKLTLDDGTVIDGFVLKPVDYTEGKTWPVLLEIHGGPKTVYGSVFYHELQLFAAQGYYVVFCNPRGSDGKGNDFSDIRGKYGTIDYEDLMNFTDLALFTYPDMDLSNLFVTGGSYGGFMTNWIIGHTNRFKAAVSQRSISNWISMFNTTDIGYYFADDQNASSPWDNHAKMWWHSPLKYADQVVTPTLFIHSEEDYRCWLTEGLQMFTALKYHNVESRLCLFKGENHELSRSGKPKHRQRRLEEISGWFARYRTLKTADE